MYEQILEMYSKLHGSKPHPELANSLNDLGFALQNTGSFNESVQYLRKAEEMNREIHGATPHYNTMVTLFNLAYSLESLDRTEETITVFKDIIEMGIQLLDPRAFRIVASSLNRLANHSKET